MKKLLVAAFFMAAFTSCKKESLEPSRKFTKEKLRDLNDWIDTGRVDTIGNFKPSR